MSSDYDQLANYYEQLKNNPEAEVKKICKFLEINFEPSMLEEKNWVELDGKAWGNRAVSSFYEESTNERLSLN